MEGLWPHIVLALLVLVAVGATVVALGLVGHPSAAGVDVSLVGQSASARTAVMLSMWSMATLVRRVLGPAPRPPTRFRARPRRRPLVPIPDVSHTA